MKQNQKKSLSERALYALIAGLIALNAATFGYIFLHQHIELRSGSFSFIDPSRRFVEQENLIVNFQPLREFLAGSYENNSKVSIYFEYIPTGANISVNRDAEFYPASLLKVPVAAAVAKKIERGEWKWTNELVLLSGDRDEMFGTLWQEPTNSTHTIEELVRRSLVDSDNTAHFILLRNLETSEVEDVYEHIGLKGFFDTDGRISAKRYSAIFRMLYTSSYLSPELSEKLLSMMGSSEFNVFIESALPKGVLFSHKIGIAVDRDVYVDSGIIYERNRPYILTVMVATKDESEAQKIMNEVSDTVYRYVHDYAEENS